jgi:lipoyl-dependent peroxiredoxin
MVVEAERKATVVWQGDLRSGRGVMESGSGVLRSVPVSFPARLESHASQTSPEELIAAAHAACFAMSLSNTITSSGKQPNEIKVEATCQLDRTDSGLVIRSMMLDASGTVPGLDDAGFQELARQAEERCPVSNALRGSVEIRQTAHLSMSVSREAAFDERGRRSR